ncbi:hypothetical protein H632_c2656p0, partial [Helicosporidium sp. ATCC 50920]
MASAAPVIPEVEIHDASQLEPAALESLLARPRLDFSSILEQARAVGWWRGMSVDAVKPIIQGVRERGDAHVAELTARFDGVNLAGPPCVPLSSLPAPELSPELRAAFDRAYANIRTFHAAQSAPDLHLSTEPGVRCSRVTRPLRA